MEGELEVESKDNKAVEESKVTETCDITTMAICWYANLEAPHSQQTNYYN